jgi:hypothetical protein
MEDDLKKKWKTPSKKKWKTTSNDLKQNGRRPQEEKKEEKMKDEQTKK